MFQDGIYWIFNHTVNAKTFKRPCFDFRDLRLEVERAVHNLGFRTEFLKNSNFKYDSDLKNSFKI